MFKFPVYELRSVADPKHENIRHYSFFLKLSNVPLGLWTDINARTQNVDKRTYRDIYDSLLGLVDTPGMFHLRNQGVVILADSINYDHKYKTVEMTFSNPELHGVVNGGHTYTLFCEAQEENPDEYVKVSVSCGIGSEYVPEIAKGLNTSLQVKTESLANLEGKFDWIKAILKAYENDVSWDENDPGLVEASDIVRYMTCLNVLSYPSEESHPLAAYSSKNIVLKNYITKVDQYKGMENILLQICQLHDHIALTAQQVWNENKNGHGKFGQTKIAKPRGKKDKTIFLNGIKSDHQLQEAVIWPILSGFRAYIEVTESGEFCWKRNFDQVIDVWNKTGHAILSKAWEISNTVPTIGLVGKNTNLWDFAFMKLQNKEATEK